jgi:hypothetical protein
VTIPLDLDATSTAPALRRILQARQPGQNTPGVFPTKANLQAKKMKSFGMTAKI